MTRITPAQFTVCAAAAAQGRPFALWRAAGDTAFTALVSTGEPQRVPVFGERGSPGFVMAPFRGDDGNMAWMFDADIVVGADGPRYRSGDGFASVPATAAQRSVIGFAGSGPVQAPEDTVPVPEPTGRADYEARVARAVATIKGGLADKIVLSRIEPRALPADYDLCALAEALAQRHAHAFVCLASSSRTGTWLVATPEILLAADGDGVRTMALAGTQWPEPDVDIAALTWSEKIVEEQALVADFVREAFEAEGIAGLRETAPATVRAANLCHLRSDFSAPPAGAAALAGLLRRLHPTSAVCGMPRARAHEFILEEEGDTRGFYTGYLGPRDLDGKTSLFVNLRSARVSGDRIFLHVGGGIVAASDPATEWQETVEKTKTIGQVL